ncbi:ABC transporter permease subunit [Streptosporangium sp. NPDC051022]|uniref:ABC transporter permease subunit n=1 Tax=Streptosporangium sp. NPDC051022 TaxID=3155752 RepID=UPI00343B9E73
MRHEDVFPFEGARRHDVFFDVTPHPDMRAPAKWHGQGRWRIWGYLLPAITLATVLLVPLLWTVVLSLREGGPANYLDVMTDQDGLEDLSVWPPLLHSAVWLLLALMVCALGLGLAWLARDAGPRQRVLLLSVLALPTVTSPLTAGVAFRLIFDVSPRGTVNALLPAPVLFTGPGWIWLVLGSAFVWQWTGLAFLVFHVGLANVPRDLLRVGRIFGAERIRLLRTVVAPALFPTAALVTLVVLTAAVRVFDVILVGAPGAIQDEVDVVGLFWWRHQDELGRGRASALAVLLFAMAAAVALLIVWRLRRDWPETGQRRQEYRAPARRRPRWLLRGVFAAVTPVWLSPFVVLLLTSFRSPQGVATSGWWTWQEYRLSGSYGDAFGDGSFSGALWATAQRGLLAAVIVVLFAVPAAYALTHERLPLRARRIVTSVTVLLAVLPPQALGGPLGDMPDGLPGGVVTLSWIHAALALPLGVLLLRNAFASVPRPVVLRPLAEGRSAIRRVTTESGPAVVTVAVLTFVLTWNDLVIGLMTNWSAANQAPLIMFQQSRFFTTSAGALAAQAVAVTAVPALLLFATGRWLVRGLTQGVNR